MFRQKRIAAVLVALVVSSMPARAQGEFDDVKIEAVEAGAGVWMLTGAGGNLGLLVGEDGAFLVDDQFAPLSEKIAAAIAQLTDRPVRFVVNTHWHPDHTGGNESLGKGGAILVAHDNVRIRLAEEQFLEFFQSRVPPSPREALPVVTFGDYVTFHWNAETVDVFHVPPAHTDGDSVVRFRRANIFHMGDLYFAGMYPFIDLGSGGSIDGAIGAVDRILGLADDQTRIIPGHGPLSDMAELALYREMLQTVRDRVAGALAEGMSVEDAAVAGLTADLDATWGGGFMKGDAFVKIVATDLAKLR